MTAALITPAARSHSLRDSAAVTARRMLVRDSTSSCSRRHRALVIHTPCVSTSSTMSYKRRSSPEISNDGASREAAGAGFGAFGAATDSDGVAVRRWMWMIGEATCEGIVSKSIWSSTAQIARTFSCRVLRIEGVFRRMLIPSEAETARSAGTATEKTKEVPLMCW